MMRRSAVINIERVAELRSLTNGEMRQCCTTARRHLSLAHATQGQLTGRIETAGRKRLTAVMVSTMNMISTISCAILKAGSDPVGASGCRAGILSKACATPTNTFKYSDSDAVMA